MYRSLSCLNVQRSEYYHKYSFERTSTIKIQPFPKRSPRLKKLLKLIYKMEIR